MGQNEAAECTRLRAQVAVLQTELDLVRGENAFLRMAHIQGMIRSPDATFGGQSLRRPMSMLNITRVETLGDVEAMCANRQIEAQHEQKDSALAQKWSRARRVIEDAEREIASLRRKVEWRTIERERPGEGQWCLLAAGDGKDGILVQYEQHRGEWQWVQQMGKATIAWDVRPHHLWLPTQGLCPPPSGSTAPGEAAPTGGEGSAGLPR